MTHRRKGAKMSEQNEKKEVEVLEENEQESPQAAETASEDPPQPASGIPSAASIAQEVVEVSWGEVEGVYRMREALKGAQQFASNLLMEQERQRRRVFSNIESMEKAMYESAGQLKDELSLNPEWVYEFKLPASPGEKAYFIRKEE